MKKLIQIVQNIKSVQEIFPIQPYNGVFLIAYVRVAKFIYI